jgi:poly-gamma-glutamate capsule biosynthesis protein CapA/YwtB (metallophosphatase superfamily)
MTMRRDTLELIAVGDISFACRDTSDPFEHTARYLRAGDIVFGNLECVLCDAFPEMEKEITLRTVPSRASYLQSAGFTVLSLANNHTLDCGSAGLAQTIAALREQCIRFVGAGDTISPEGFEIITCCGLRVGFLGYGETDASGTQDGVFINRLDRRAILDQLRGFKPDCDIVAVSLHWGIEYARYPSPAQTALARELVAEGATLVLGHHPHVVQGIEQIGGSLIAYSLGSFQSQPMREEGTRQSFMLHARIGRRGVERYRLVPIRVDPDNRPRPARRAERRETMNLVRRVSQPIRENRITERWWFAQVSPVYLRGNLEAWMRRVRKYGIAHFVQFMRWLVSRFTIKCYVGLLRRRMRLDD